MNRFETTFFQKYLPKNETMKEVFHRDIFLILNTVIFWMVIVVVSSVFYHQIETKNAFELAGKIEFIYFEMYLIAIWLWVMYKVFDWYNDVWILSDSGIIDVNWTLLKTNTSFTEYENIEGVEVNEPRWWYSIIRSGDVVIHKISTDLRMKRMYKPGQAVQMIQECKSSLGEEEENEEVENESGGSDMHIYLDGVDHSFSRKKLGGSEDEIEQKYIEKISQKDDTIDLRN